MTVHFFLPLKKIPTVTAQEHKIKISGGKPIVYKPEKLKAAKRLFKAHLSKYAPEAPYTGAVRLTVKWLFPKGKSHADGEYKTTRPDTDNLQKLLKDCMTKTKYWTDDAQVASELSQKFHSKITGIWIMVRELEVIDEE